MEDGVESHRTAVLMAAGTIGASIAGIPPLFAASFYITFHDLSATLASYAPVLFYGGFIFILLLSFVGFIFSLAALGYHQRTRSSRLLLAISIFGIIANMLWLVVMVEFSVASQGLYRWHYGLQLFII